MPSPETNTTPKLPTWMETARRFYGPGFEVRTSQALSGSNADWAELPEHERSFTIAHLLYLNLVAQRGTQRLLGEVRDLLDEIAAGEAEDEDDDPEPDDDGPAGAEAEREEAEPIAEDAPVAVEAELIIPGEDGRAA